MTKKAVEPTVTSARRLPAVKRFTAEIRTGKQQKRPVAEYADWLAAQSSRLQQWSDIEDVALAAVGDPPDKFAKAVCHHVTMVRAEIAQRLWARHVFVGVTVLDNLLFRSARSGAPDPVQEVLETLRDSRLDGRSLLVFPLQSYGVLAAGLLRPFRNASTEFLNPSQRFMLSPQTNSLTRTTELINDAGPQLGVKKPVDHGLVEHWRASRDARWLEYNPLLIAGVTSIRGYYYENEFLLLGRVRAITAAVAMLATLQPRREERAGLLFSSSQINNWETRDIRHYILLTDAPGKHLTGEAVPIHKRRDVDALSDLAVELDPRYWGRRPGQEAEVYGAVQALYDGYLQHSIGRRPEDALSRTYRKIFDAVDYFRRSHQGSHQDWSAAVSLATAFEMILTDQFDRGVAERLRRRVELLLKGVPGTRRYQTAVVELYDARSGTVHRGEVTDLNLDRARRAFVLVFLELMRRVHHLQPKQVQPIAFLTADPQP